MKIHRMDQVEQRERIGAGALDAGTVDETDERIIRYVNQIIVDALSREISDIHIEPYEKAGRLRYRRDGILQVEDRPSTAVVAAIVRRFQVMAGITPEPVPHHGRVVIQLPVRQVCLRISIMPTHWGDRLSLRVLNEADTAVNTVDLGLEPAAFDRFQQCLRAPYGLLLMTGPTGSGRTTTLYSAVRSLNSDAVNIATIESPVEYELPGVNHFQFIPDGRMNFSNYLHFVFKQDPDVLMLGDLTEEGMMRVAVQAARSGLLVLASMNATGAAGAIARSQALGASGDDLSETVRMVQSQRLVRQICRACRTEEPVAQQTHEALGITPELLSRLDLPHLQVDEIRFFQGSGCDQCNNTGYRGRLAVHEVMPLSARLARAVQVGRNCRTLHRIAREEGMYSMKESALRKALLGCTTLSEVHRVSPKD
jgi:type IV pilus assembly protein PilB